MLELFTDHTYAMTLWGSMAIGITAGCLGSFAYLRRQSLISDVISHSSLPGVLGAFLILTMFGISGRSLVALIIGAVLVGTLAMYLVNLIPRVSLVRLDTAMAVVLSSFFGLGMLMLQYISRNPFPDKGGVSDYLFGNASSLTRADVYSCVIVGALTIGAMVLCFKEFTAHSFDPEFTRVVGLNSRIIDAALFASITIATVIGLKAVGLVLMVAFVVSPPAVARQWVTSTAALVALSGIIGAISAAIGSYLSIKHGPMPTGPVIVVVLFIFLVASLVLSPRRRHAQAVA
ncbi:metal ABC transporter permease [Corynebacterium uterequi]|uniref:ABC-type Mn2+/Zn2+ transport system, permease component n=1 Tax=Corynebacterium uterequi TaxID=1072256 RepID=A0A0G3HER1_9CORY|nr:metal ABC transporter permease [Corynebacterium uterequi]AKK10463.1 ABC-type Mn2+/Zn2+ transport system, permease component [Corynebacterium uterequi]